MEASVDRFNAGIAVLPSFDEVKDDKLKFVEATRVIHINTNPFNAKTLVQAHDDRVVVVNPPCLPLKSVNMATASLIAKLKTRPIIIGISLG